MAEYLSGGRIQGSSTADGALGSGLKAYYKFDESSGNIVNVANTITGNSTLGTGQNITMNGDPTYSVTGTPSSFGNAVSCDGSGDYGQFGTKADWNFLHTTGATWTLNVWLKFDATVAGNKQLIDNNRTADSTIGLNIRTQTDNKFRVIMARGVGNSSTLDTDNDPNLPIPTDNAWHMYTFRWDQSSGNGVLTYNTDASNEVTANGSGNGTTTSDCTDSLRLFSQSNAVGGELDAEISEMSIYNTVLTDANLTSLYNSGAGKLLTTAGSVDEKTNITNVPEGTRYEEIDTRKIFRRHTQTGSEGVDQWVAKGTEAPASSALRGCWAGGYASAASNVIDYVVISTIGDAADFGDLTRSNAEMAGCSNDTRGLWCCGSNSNTDTIDYTTVATLGNATDFGNASASKYGVAALADATRACVAGGNTGSRINVIDYFTIASPGNASDFGNLSVEREKPAGNADTTRGLIGGGKSDAGRSNVIDYITIQTTGNATDFGNLTEVREELGSCADATRACWAGGVNGSSESDIIDYVTMQTTGNATDFGNLLSATEICSGNADSTRGLIAGGRVSGSNTNVIAYITIQSVGNATDFGNLTDPRRGLASGVAA